MEPASRHFIRVDCAERSCGDVLAELERTLARAAARKVRPVIVLLHLVRLRGSLVTLFKELTALVMRTEPRPVIVDGSRYAATFLEHYPGAVPIVVCEEEPRSDDPRRVLVVEDHEDNQEFLCHLIRSAGHRCVGASSVAEAVRHIDRESHDLIFLDLKLPDGDGLDVARHVAGRGLRVPLVAVSAHLDAGAPPGGRFGIRRTIRKPFQIREILDVLQDASIQA